MRIHLIPKAWSEHGVEALWTGQKNILLSCPQCLDSMLAPGFWNKVYGSWMLAQLVRSPTTNQKVLGLNPGLVEG